MNVIMKFGGTSVADAEAIGRVIEIIRGHITRYPAHRVPVVVVSAMSKVTDRLVEIGRLIQDGDGNKALSIVAELHARHEAAASALVSGDALRVLLTQITDDFTSLRANVERWMSTSEVTPAATDTLLSTGELVNSRIVAAAFTARGVRSAWVDARRVLVTDREFTAAAPDTERTTERARALVAPVVDAGDVPVLGGFIGATVDGEPTTLGRGGSDYSAAIFGACLDVDEIQIWTDVDGMLTADPRVVAEPYLVPQLSFAEASELAYFGAKVLHPSTILPAVAKNIPVRILNSRRPEVKGTMITADGRPHAGLTALACKRGLTVVDITSTRMLMAHGFLRRLFEVFERFKTPVDVVTTSEVSVSVTVDNPKRLDEIISNLWTFADVNVEREMAIVCVVGENLRSEPRLFARAVTALGDVPLRLVSQAASRRNITFVLRDADVTRAMNLLHGELFTAAVAS
ncbi:MAG: lysine-sensitive aspartokinase 3 [Acidobacteriaceae bacterium]|nr:lysine-sensitive aspartokinase 3 [Acidobacteriaceae bacterium]